MLETRVEGQLGGVGEFITLGEPRVVNWNTEDVTLSIRFKTRRFKVSFGSAFSTAF